MMDQEFMTALLEKNLRFIYDAEHQILEGLRDMIAQAISIDLQRAFQRHEKETRHQIKRLDDAAHTLLIDFKKDQTTVKKAFNKGKEIIKDTLHIGTTPRTIIHSLIEDTKSLMKSLEEADAEVIDMALANSAALIEQAEIGAYQTLCYLAEELEEPESLLLLQQNLDEEKNMLSVLTKFTQQEFRRKPRTLAGKREFSTH